jgi:hypothetical protein
LSITLPTTVQAVESTNPGLFVLYSQPKCGKTTIVAKLPDTLIIDLERGTRHVEALKYSISSLKELHALGEEIKKAGKPYKRIVIDTISKLEDWCEEAATKKYKASNQGKNFTGQSVLELPNGAGYLHLRLAYRTWLDYIREIADEVILVAHIKDKITEKNGKEVSSKDLNLIGKVRDITCNDADAIAYMYRDGDKIMFSFQSSEELTCGARPAHLKGQLVHVGTYNKATNDIETFWDKVYK